MHKIINKKRVKMDGQQWDSNPQEEKYVILEIQPCCSQGYFSDIYTLLP